MANTLVGVYDRISEAQGAYDELLSCGFDRGDLQLSPSDESSDARQAALSSVGSTSDESTDHSFGSGIRRFFHDLFSGSDEYQEHADVYAEAVRRGHFLVTVHADNDEERVQATQVMNRFNPIDIEERAAGWRSRGWTKYDETAPVLKDSEIVDERRHYATGPSTTMSTAATSTAAAGSALSGTTNAPDATLADTSRADATYGVKDTTATTDTDTYRDRTAAAAADASMSDTTAASDMSRSEATTAARAASVNEMSQSDAFRPEGTAATTATTAGTFKSDTDTSRPSSYATAETSRMDSTTASPMTDKTIREADTTSLADTDMASRRGAATGTSMDIGSSADSKTIPVIQEELQIGKREVQRGGVRVYQRVKETPVDQSVRLHEEHVHVERHPVDRPASEADLSGLKETSFELRETAEEAVVGKTARIVEEVVVSKEASERTQEIHDKVRRTDVEVEQLGASARETSAGIRAGDEDFRHHFQTTYGQTSDRFEDYEPAYRYGSTLAADERYRGHRWDESEEDVHADWESHYGAATPWEKAKNAVRYGWERATR